MEVTLSRGQASASTGETISAKALATGGDGNYKYSWKVLLNGEEISDTDLSMGDSYSWTTEEAGTYVFTVTVVDGNNDSVTNNSQGIVVSQSECAHESYTDIPGTVTYEQVSDAKHNKVTLISRVCDNCGETISEFKQTESEDHIFENGICAGCGLAEPTADCQHVNSEEKLTDSVISDQGNTAQHIVTETYSVICLDCGITIRTFEQKVFEDHAFNNNGVCSCGYAKPTPECDHAEHIEVLTGTPTYVNNYGRGHTKTATVRVECAICGIVLEEEKTVTVTESHSFEDGVCACGQSEHVHSYVKNLLSSVVEKDNNSKSTHFVVNTYVEICECGATNATSVVRTTAQCTFVKNAGVQAKHENKGHQYFDRCSCGNAVVNGRFTPYLSTCSTCRQQYGDSVLAKGIFNSSKVEELQQMLGFTGKAVDGDFGDNTESAVIEFQKKHGLPATGIVDDSTWAQLVTLQNKVTTQQQPEQPESTNSTCKHDWFIKDDSGYAKHPHTVIFECKICGETKSENMTKLLCCACGNGEHVWVSTHPATSHKHPMVYKCSMCNEILTKTPAYDAKCIECNPNNYQWPDTPTSKELKQNMATGEDYIAIRETDEFRDEYLYAPNGGVWESDITHFANGVGTGLSEIMGVKSAIYKAVYISPKETQVLSVYMRQMQQIIANDTLQTWVLGLFDDLEILDGDLKSLTTGGDMVEDKVIEVLMESGYANSEVPLERLRELESMMALTPLDLPGVDAVLNTKDLIGWELPDNEGGKVLDVIETALKWYDFVSTINYTYLAPIIENAAQNGNGLVYEYTVNFDHPIEMEWIAGKYTPTNNYAVAPSLGEWVGVDTDGDGVKEWYMSSEYDLYGTYEANPY